MIVPTRETRHPFTASFLYRNNYKSKLGRNKTLSIPLTLDTSPAGMKRYISIVQPKPTIH